jgi:hypothetical protein
LLAEATRAGGLGNLRDEMRLASRVHAAPVRLAHPRQHGEQAEFADAIAPHERHVLALDTQVQACEQRAPARRMNRYV